MQHLTSRYKSNATTHAAVDRLFSRQIKASGCTSLSFEASVTFNFIILAKFLGHLRCMY